MSPRTSATPNQPWRRGLILLIAFVAMLSLAATSCGGSSSTTIETNDDASAASAPDDDAGAESPNDADEPAASSDSSSPPRESPIGDLLGVPVSDDDAMEEYFGQLQKDAEAKIAQCMRAEGFEYTPVDYSQFENFSGADFESREFAETRGFGANPFPIGEIEEQLEDFTDPNQEYMMSLTPGEREAYQTALSGELPDFDPSSDEEFFFEPSGCQGQAYEEAFSFSQVFEEFGDELEAMEASYEADPRIVKAHDDWSRCMSDAGFSYASSDDARDAFFDRYSTIMRNPDVFEAPEIDPDNPPSEGEMLFFDGPPKLKPEVRAELDAILAEEVEVATASWDCSEPVKAIEREVQIEAEQKFVDEYGDQIRAALDATS